MESEREADNEKEATVTVWLLYALDIRIRPFRRYVCARRVFEVYIYKVDAFTFYMAQYV